MTRQTKSLLPPLFFLLLLIALLVVAPVHSEVVHPYDWVKVGAYAKYTTFRSLELKFLNDTRIWFKESAPVVLEWTIVEKHEATVHLNVTFLISGFAYILPPGVTVFEAEYRNVTYRKTLFFDVDVYTREAVLDGQASGKTFFWAEPYRMPGEEFVVSSPPSDLILGNVSSVGTRKVLGKEIKVYRVWVCQLDPFAWASYTFDWYSGVAISFTLMGPVEIAPGTEGQHGITFPNGTVYRITRYAADPVGTNLRLNVDDCILQLSETNINIGVETVPEPEPETDDGASVWKYLPYMFVAALAGSAITFLLIRRRRKTTGTR